MGERLPQLTHVHKVHHANTIPVELQKKKKHLFHWGERKNLTCLVFFQQTCTIQTAYEFVHQNYVSMAKLQCRQGFGFMLLPRWRLQKNNTGGNIKDKWFLLHLFFYNLTSRLTCQLSTWHSNGLWQAFVNCNTSVVCTAKYFIINIKEKVTRNLTGLFITW